MAPRGKATAPRFGAGRTHHPERSNPRSRKVEPYFPSVTPYFFFDRLEEIRSSCPGEPPTISRLVVIFSGKSRKTSRARRLEPGLARFELGGTRNKVGIGAKKSGVGAKKSGEGARKERRERIRPRSSDDEIAPPWWRSWAPDRERCTDLPSTKQRAFKFAQDVKSADFLRFGGARLLDFC